MARIYSVFSSTMYSSYLVPLLLEEMYRLRTCIGISIHREELISYRTKERV
jgi:hypothetical protein